MNRSAIALCFALGCQARENSATDAPPFAQNPQDAPVVDSVAPGPADAGKDLVAGRDAAIPDAQPGSGIVLGAGTHRYEWVVGWAKLPSGMTFGNTHGGIVVDGKGRIYVSTDSQNAVIVFDKDGTFVKSWGKEYQATKGGSGGIHGLTLAKEGNQEILYFAHLDRHEVVKATLDGVVLATFPYPDRAGIYMDASEYLPTSIALGPGGDLYVADGYGKSWVHQLDGTGQYIRSFGGEGTEPGKFSTPHALWLDTRTQTPELLVADRENHRLQWFDLEGKFLRLVENPAIANRPAGIHQLGTDLVIADLEAQVTIIDKSNKVVATLGKNTNPAQAGQNMVPHTTWKNGLFIAPHSARFDASGDLYVMDWNFEGRINKLKHIE